MIVKTVKTMTGKVTTIETDNFFVKVSTAKEGFFKKPSTVILVLSPSDRFGLKSVGKIIYASSLSREDCYKMHDTVCNMMDEDGKLFTLHESIDITIFNLNQDGLLAEGINLSPQ